MESESKVYLPGEHMDHRTPRTPSFNVGFTRTAALFELVFSLTLLEPKHRTTLQLGARGNLKNYNLLSLETHFTFALQAQYPLTWCPLHL